MHSHSEQNLISQQNTQGSQGTFLKKKNTYDPNAILQTGNNNNVPRRNSTQIGQS